MHIEFYGLYKDDTELHMINELLGHLPKQLYINGEWTDSVNQETVSVVNPATNRQIAKVSYGSSEDAKKSIAAAKKAFEVWSSYDVQKRSMLFYQLADKVDEHIDELSLILTMEQGKPLAQSKGEISAGSETLRWYAAELKRINGEILTSPDAHVFLVKKVPLGIVGAITPWNFPFSMVVRKIAPALAAGNTVILKPSPETPLIAIALTCLIDEVGFPEGVFNLITGDAESIGKALTESNDVRKIAFTGSTNVGKLLYRQSSNTLKKLSLELGGHAPFIVYEDADLDLAVEDLVKLKFRNNGQVCVSPNRIFVHASIYERFVSKLIPLVKKMKVGNGLDEGTDIGPLIRENAIEKISKQIQDAVNKGAGLIAGGRRMTINGLESGYFFEPTVLTGVTKGMDIFYQETFGPVIPIIIYEYDEEVISSANDTTFGLASYFYTKNMKRVFNVSDSLQYGMVAVNSNVVSYTQAPFGGVKHSGFGRENGHYGIDEYVTYKFINIKY